MAAFVVVTEVMVAVFDVPLDMVTLPACILWMAAAAKDTTVAYTVDALDASAVFLVAVTTVALVKATLHKVVLGALPLAGMVQPL